MQIAAGVRVTGFGISGNAVTSVETDQGAIACDQLVIAAGPWIRDLWAWLDLPDTITVAQPGGTGGVARARQLAINSERHNVAAEVRDLVGRSGLSRQDFADRIGTSRSRLSTYMSGKVVPSATLMVRMRRVALHASKTAS